MSFVLRAPSMINVNERVERVFVREKRAREGFSTRTYDLDAKNNFSLTLILVSCIKISIILKFLPGIPQSLNFLSVHFISSHIACSCNVKQLSPSRHVPLCGRGKIWTSWPVDNFFPNGQLISGTKCEGTRLPSYACMN